MTEIQATIASLNAKKTPGHDLINEKIIKELPKKGISLIASIFYSILRLNYYPTPWKLSIITLIHKPAHEVTSYRPISFLPTLSKLFKKMQINRLLEVLKDSVIPDHQFKFRKRHSTIEQIHRIIRHLSQDLKRKKYCSVFLNIRQAFDSVHWATI